MCLSALACDAPRHLLCLPAEMRSSLDQAEIQTCCCCLGFNVNPPFLGRTLTSRTSPPAGVMGWPSAPWCTPSFPPSLITTLCHQPTANTTLNWPSEPRSEWRLKRPSLLFFSTTQMKVQGNTFQPFYTNVSLQL